MIELLNMDCMEYMKGVPDKHFDLAVVDPPYGMPKDSTHGRGKLKNRILNNGGVEKWDEAPNQDYFDELFRVSENQIIWGGNYFGLRGTREFCIWDKEQPFENFSAAEYAWTSFNGVSKIFRQATTRTGENKIHPTQKPVRLYKWLLHHYAELSFKILDTHLGSASSAIAAYDYGVKEFIGIEIDKDYYNAALKRFNTHKQQLRIAI